MKKAKSGRIITFYSFKGGVGRTMAVANVALLAAMNGKRVLVMDWDLEAPGLFYYFRGLLDRSIGSSAEDGPGVLDFLCEWASAVKSPLADNEFDELQSRFVRGEPFRECVKNLIEPALASTLLPSGAKLDFIGAGGRTIHCNPPTPYEEVLAKFSWPDFFEEHAGGYVLDNLRRWARENYDIVLIDSRTGLADVAGICTMLLPDTVALCFVLNQQNIDGVAKVAASVRATDGTEIILRAIPMKVARRESADASDAQAKALKELTRVGGFSAADALKDFQLLYVALEDNVPFYETLAPFVPVDPTFDPLTLAYLRIANELVDDNISMPAFPPTTLKIIKRRLMPSNATVQYVSELKSAEPSRAFSEIDRLTESAIGTDTDGGILESEYVSALFEATIDLVNRSDEPEEILALQSRLLDLLRRLNRGDSKQWADVLISAIERTFEMIFLFDKDDKEISLLDEIDGVLATRSEPDYCMKRMAYKRRLARLLLAEKRIDSVTVTVDSILEIANSIDQSRLKEAEKGALNETKIDTKLLSGEVCEFNGQVAQAAEYYRAGLEIAHAASRTEAEYADLRFNLHLKLATILKGAEAVEHAVRAVEIESRLFVRHFVPLAEIVLKMSTSIDDIFAFCRVAFGDWSFNKRSGYVRFFGRMPSRALDFVNVINGFCRQFIIIDSKEAEEILKTMMSISSQIAKALLSRRQYFGKKGIKSLSEAFGSLVAFAEDAHFPADTTRGLEEALGSLRKMMDNPTI